MPRTRYKLFVNNVQIGNYATMKDLLTSIRGFAREGETKQKVTQKGNSYYLTV